MWPWRGYDRGVGSWVARVAGDGVITKASSNQDKALANDGNPAGNQSGEERR